MANIIRVVGTREGGNWGNQPTLVVIPYMCKGGYWSRTKITLSPTCQLSYPCRTQVCTLLHCWKSSFFVQKFNFDFPRKLSVFFGVKNSWKCCGFVLFNCWQNWFHEKNCQKNFGWKLVKMLGFCQNWIR